MSKEKEIEKKEEREIVTIQDFKSMLIGMDLILGESWTPNEQQWKRIRSKLDALLETADRPVLTPRPFVPGSGPASVVPNLNVSDHELISAFPAVPVAANVPIGMQPTESALTSIPTTPATPVGSDNNVHRTDEFI